MRLPVRSYLAIQAESELSQLLRNLYRHRSEALGRRTRDVRTLHRRSWVDLHNRRAYASYHNVRRVTGAPRQHFDLRKRSVWRAPPARAPIFTRPNCQPREREMNVHRRLLPSVCTEHTCAPLHREQGHQLLCHRSRARNRPHQWAHSPRYLCETAQRCARWGK
jgi:hypothetical protein